MAKHRKYERPENRSSKFHPIWRGIGCLLIVIVPFMSYILALDVVRIGLKKGWPIPPELLGQIKFPVWIWKVNILTILAAYITKINNLGAILAVFLILLLMFSGIITSLYAGFYRVVGPPRYSPIDAPPYK